MGAAVGVGHFAVGSGGGGCGDGSGDGGDVGSDRGISQNNTLRSYCRICMFFEKAFGTYGQTVLSTDLWTDPLIEMRGQI